MIRPRVVQVAVGLVAFCVLGAFWAEYIRYNHLTDRNASVQRSTANNYSVVLNGRRLDLADPNALGLRLVSGSPSPAPNPKPVLLLVSNDTCQASVQMLPKWLELVGSLPVGQVDLALISLKGQQIPDQLADAAAKRGFAHWTFSVERAEQFIRSTGLRSTPNTVLVDQARRAQMFVVGSYAPVEGFERGWVGLLHQLLSTMDKEGL